MMRTGKQLLLVAMIIAGVSFGALAHPVMAGSADPMHADMPCCEPIVTGQDAAPSSIVATVDITPVALPTLHRHHVMLRPPSTAPSLRPLPKIPKQLSLVGCIFKRE